MSTVSSRGGVVFKPSKNTGFVGRHYARQMAFLIGFLWLSSKTVARRWFFSSKEYKKICCKDWSFIDDLAQLNSPDKVESAAMCLIHPWKHKKSHWLHPEASLLKEWVTVVEKKNGGAYVRKEKERKWKGETEGRTSSKTVSVLSP